MKRVLFGLILLPLFSISGYSQPGTVKSFKTIASGQGGLSQSIDLLSLGYSITCIGDLDKDGNADIISCAVNASYDPLLLVLFMNGNGTVKSHVELEPGTGGLPASISFSDQFGSGITSLGDLNGDGIPDIAIGSSGRSPADQGGVWILLMNTDGTIKSASEIKEGSGGFIGNLEDDDRFGDNLAYIGDLDKDSVPDIAVGATGDDDGGNMYGALWILFMKKDGTVKSSIKLSNSSPLLNGNIKGQFGSSIALLGDYNKDGKTDLAVGSLSDGPGALFLLSLNSDGTVFSSHKIDENTSGLSGKLSPSESFGSSMASLGDIDGDGMPDLAVGALRKNYGTGANWGKEYILLLNQDGSIKTVYELDNLQGPFARKIKANDRFGRSTAVIPDIDGDSVPELIITADGSDTAGTDKGVIYICLMNGVPVQPNSIAGTDKQEMHIFPNPATTELHVLIPPSLTAPPDINIYNNMGQLVKKAGDTYQPGSTTLLIDVSDLPAGYYFIEYRYHDVVRRNKITVAE